MRHAIIAVLLLAASVLGQEKGDLDQRLKERQQIKLHDRLGMPLWASLSFHGIFRREPAWSGSILS